MNEKGKIVGRVSIFWEYCKKNRQVKILSFRYENEYFKGSLRSAFSCCFCAPQQNPFDNSQPFFHYVIGLLLWHSISQLRTAITTMHWETNGHLGGMPLQLYHLVTPGGHRARDDCMWLRSDMEKKLICRKLRRHTCDCVALISHAVSVAGLQGFTHTHGFTLSSGSSVTNMQFLLLVAGASFV